MIDVKKLFKSEGKRKEKVKVTRGGKTFWRDQMVGRKESEVIPTGIKSVRTEEKPSIQIKNEKKIAELNDRILELYGERKIINMEFKRAKKIADAASDKVPNNVSGNNPIWQAANKLQVIASNIKRKAEEKTEETMRLSGKIQIIASKEEKRKDKIIAEAKKKSNF